MKLKLHDRPEKWISQFKKKRKKRKKEKELLNGAPENLVYNIYTLYL